MIELSDAAASVLTRSFRRYVRAESWLGEQLLAEDIPISAGAEQVDRALSVPERVTLQVPLRDRGTSWAPVDDDSPLAANGQRLRVELGVGIGHGAIEWLTRGWFVIHSAKPQGAAVDVELRGLLQLVDEARLVSPYQPSGTLGSTVRGLVEPALTVAFDTGLTDRAVPAGMNIDEDRLAGVYSVLDAWGADARVTEEGWLEVGPAADPTEAVLDLTDGAGGTVVDVAGESTREGAVNAVVARGTDSAGNQVQGVAYDTSGGPKQYGGDFNPLPVPEFFESPLLTTVAQAQLAARTRLARKLRAVARTFEVACVPHPALQAGDLVTLTSGRLGLQAQPCVVERLTLPYLPGGGAMQLAVRTVA
ncbi:MAG TPA: DUF5047 domain-containing protein [Pseudonocardia sp.]|nr:DUF5047 domain-containing protein [Pseudonocardia sp.]